MYLLARFFFCELPNVGPCGVFFRSALEGRSASVYFPLYTTNALRLMPCANGIPANFQWFALTSCCCCIRCLSVVHHLLEGTCLMGVVFPWAFKRCIMWMFSLGQHWKTNQLASALREVCECVARDPVCKWHPCRGFDCQCNGCREPYAGALHQQFNEVFPESAR